MNPSTPVEVPDTLVAWYRERNDTAGLGWLAALPRLAADMMDRWSLRPDGPAGHGQVSLVLPVLRADGTPAALKLQPLGEESAAAPIGLRAWNGDGSVRLLDHDPGTGTMLLERLDAGRPLSAMADETAALRVLAGLLARLVAVPAPPELRTLGDITAAMLAAVPAALPALREDAERQLVRDCAAVTADLAGEPGDRLLHWDLHYDNILGGEREPWLAIDPQPLAGDPGFELLPALDNRWDEIVATGDVPRAVLGRFDLLTEALALDRRRATGWTLARVLQNALWAVEDGETAVAPDQVAIATALLAHRRP